MRAWMIALVACSAPAPPPVKRPNTELIVGAFERRPPTGEQAMRFDADGRFRIAKTRAELERTPHLAEGTYRLEGGKLTFTVIRGECTGAPGVYDVVISKVGIRFSRVTDDCDERSKLDGQTWWRIL